MTSPGNAFAAKAKRQKKPKPTPAELGMKLIERCHQFKLNLATAKKLVEDGADVTLTGNYGQTALMGCASHARPEYAELAALLIAKGAPLDAALTPSGTTAISWGTNHGNTAVVLQLIAAGCRLDLCTDEGRSPLHLAAERGHVEMVRAMIAAGADINLQDRFGYTPLGLLAASAHQKESITACAELLLEAGADFTIANKFQRTPYDQLSSNKMLDGSLRYPEIREMIGSYNRRKAEAIANNILATKSPVTSGRHALKIKRRP